MLNNLLFERRSIRKYRDNKVEKEKVEAILKGALTAPTGRNLKPTEIIVVENEEILKRLSDTRGQVTKPLASAPLAFAIIGDTRQSTTWMSDTAIMAIIVQLLAEEQGLKSCWLHIEKRASDDGSSSEDNVREVLGIPDYYIPHCIIVVGYPDEEIEPYREEDLDFTRVHWNKF